MSKRIAFLFFTSTMIRLVLEFTCVPQRQCALDVETNPAQDTGELSS